MLFRSGSPEEGVFKPGSEGASQPERGDGTGEIKSPEDFLKKMAEMDVCAVGYPRSCPERFEDGFTADEKKNPLREFNGLYLEKIITGPNGENLSLDVLEGFKRLIDARMLDSAVKLAEEVEKAEGKGVGIRTTLKAQELGLISSGNEWPKRSNK